MTEPAPMSRSREEILYDLCLVYARAAVDAFIAESLTPKTAPPACAANAAGGNRKIRTARRTDERKNLTPTT